MSSESSIIHGHCDSEFLPVRELFEQQFKDGVNYGASVALWLPGRGCVIDLYGGHLDEAQTPSRPWQADTVQNIYSASKGWVALCAHVLKDRGHLDYDAPVCQYWPEFAAAGKEEITVRQVLSHRSGVQSLRESFYDIEDTTDWSQVTSALAGQAPLWKPGTYARYHAFTFGHLVGEIVRRCDPLKRSVGTFFKEEVLKPLRLQDMIFLGGAPSSRCASVFSGNEPEVYKWEKMGGKKAFDKEVQTLLADYDSSVGSGDPDVVRAGLAKLQYVININPQRHCALTNTELWRASELPASGGYTNARGLACLYGALASGEQSVISQSTLDGATQTVWSTGVMAPQDEFGGGFSLQTLGKKKTPRAFGHGGKGGQIAFGDPDQRGGLGFGFTGIRCVTPGRGVRLPGLELAIAVYQCLNAAKPTAACRAPAGNTSRL